MPFSFPISIVVGGSVQAASGTVLNPILTAMLCIVSFASIIGAFGLFTDRQQMKKICPEALTIWKARKTHQSLLMIPDNGNMLDFKVAEKGDKDSIEFKYDGNRGFRVDPAILSGVESYTLLGSNIKAYLWPVNFYFPTGDKGMRTAVNILSHVRNTRVENEETQLLDYNDDDDIEDAEYEEEYEYSGVLDNES